MSRRAALLALALLALPAACGDAGDAGLAAPTAPAPVLSAAAAVGPRAAFEDARAARAADDYGTLYDLLAPATQKEFLGTVLVHCSFATLGPDTERNARNEAALDAIFAKHGVTGVEDNPLQALAEAADTLPNPGALAADLAAFALEHRGRAGVLELVEVRDIEVEGDRAVGAAVLRDDYGDKPPRDVEFLRIDDRWRLRITLQ